MATKIFIVKFYESQADFDNKNPFHTVELAGSDEEIKAKAEEIKTQINAACYKIKERNF